MDNSELYQKLDEEIQNAVDNYPVHEWTLHDLEIYADNMMGKYGDQLISQQGDDVLAETDMLTQQQCWRGDGHWERDRGRCRNGGFFCRKCDFRDYVRLGVLRYLFDRRWY